jgi:lipid II:glycine glycyltransferase (peptidoglycan interpeptide bridge formation enzyme)
MEVSSWLTGRRGVSLPFTDYCEPNFEGAQSLRALTDAAIKLGGERRWKYVEFRSEHFFGEEAPASLTYWQHEVALDKDEKVQFAALKGPVRTAIRKAIGTGVRVEAVHTLDGVRNFCRLNAMTRRAHGLPPQPMSFFENLHRHVIDRDAGVVVQALVDGRPAAASVYLYRGERAIFKYGASDKRFQNLRVNDLVMWAGIRWLATRGCTKMSMGKTAVDNVGLRRFKQGWGAEEKELRYFKYDLAAGSLVRDRDAVAGWHNAFFRMMPAMLSRLAGAALYRHMA